MPDVRARTFKAEANRQAAAVAASEYAADDQAFIDVDSEFSKELRSRGEYYIKYDIFIVR